MVEISVVIPVGPKEKEWSAWENVFSAAQTQAKDLVEIFEFLFVICDPAQESQVSMLLAKFNTGFKCRVVRAPLGRAKQLNAGAKAAAAEILFFCHFDSDLNLMHLQLLADQRNSLDAGRSLHYFKFNTKERSLAFLLTKWGVLFRSQLLKIPFGDQGFVLSKKLFFEMGAFDESRPFAEDHYFVWRCHRRRVRLHVFEMELKTSGRKYLSQGWLKVSQQHVFLTLKQLVNALAVESGLFKRGALVFFVKSPELSAVKTRLAKDLGTEPTKEFYELCLARLSEWQRQLAEVTDLQVVFALAEDGAPALARWRGQSCLVQGEGELGERLFHIQEKLKSHFSHWIFMGADSPQICKDDILKAHELLKEKVGAVLGKAMDGGYYLYGSSRVYSKDEWLAVPYSAPNTANEFLKILSQKERVKLLGESFDVDNAQDLRLLRQSLEKKDSAAKSTGKKPLTSVQVKLLEFLQDKTN